VQTSFEVTYLPQSSYTAVAGVGPFNASLVTPYIQNLQSIQPNYPLKIMPYSIQAMATNIILNPLYSVVTSPVECSGYGCESFLMSGGLMMATPDVPPGYFDPEVTVLKSVLSRHLDFQQGIETGDVFQDDDCSLYDDNSTIIAMKFCLKKSYMKPHSMIAGILYPRTFELKVFLLIPSPGVFVCPNGASNNQCLLNSTDMLPNTTTTFSIYNRRATVEASISNSTIISSSNVNSEVNADSDIDIPAFKTALDWVLDYHSAGIPATSSIVQLFWTGQPFLRKNPYTPELYNAFRSILAFPIWVFNVNNFGNIDFNGSVINPRLPQDYYTAIDIATPHTKIIIQPSLYAAFIAFQCSLQVFFWGVLVWLAYTEGGTLPEISDFPLFDFALKARYTLPIKHMPSDGHGEKVLLAKTSDILEQLETAGLISCATDTVFEDRMDSLQLDSGVGASHTSIVMQGTDIAAQSQMMPEADLLVGGMPGERSSAESAHEHQQIDVTTNQSYEE
jgi:hypothetical protein